MPSETAELEGKLKTKHPERREPGETELAVFACLTAMSLNRYNWGLQRFANGYWDVYC